LFSAYTSKKIFLINPVTFKAIYGLQTICDPNANSLTHDEFSIPNTPVVYQKFFSKIFNHCRRFLYLAQPIEGGLFREPQNPASFHGTAAWS
jgi:hypothetical protein